MVCDHIELSLQIQHHADLQNIIMINKEKNTGMAHDHIDFDKVHIIMIIITVYIQEWGMT